MISYIISEPSSRVNMRIENTSDCLIIMGVSCTTQVSSANVVLRFPHLLPPIDTRHYQYQAPNMLLNGSMSAPYTASLQISISCQEKICSAHQCQTQPLHTPWSHVIKLSVPALSASFPVTRMQFSLVEWKHCWVVVNLSGEFVPVNQHKMPWNIMPWAQIFVWKQPMMLSWIFVWFI